MSTAVLGIETSCDETAAAVVDDGLRVRSSVVSSQVDLHSPFGGVVPEIAGRAHQRLLPYVVAQALSVEQQLSGAPASPPPPRRIVPDAVAATAGPGLTGALVVGVSAAKALSLAWDVPFVAVNHLEAHLYAAFLENPDIPLPMVVLLVSGGHTILVHMTDHGRYELLGQTADDAVGEAFDKVARLLSLGYPGGPIIDRLAAEGDPEAMAFPRPMLGKGLDFSFSGLKTAVAVYLRKHPDAVPADVAASFQRAVGDVLLSKASAAMRECGTRNLTLAGGVAANSELRSRFEGLDAQTFLPSRAMCTDNAAMVAAAGWWQLQREGPSPLHAGAEPSWGIGA